MVLCGTKNGSYMASLEEPFEAPFIFKSVVSYFTSSVVVAYVCVLLGFCSLIQNHLNNRPINHGFPLNSRRPVDRSLATTDIPAIYFTSQRCITVILL